jgi:hypothetical protein
MSIRSQPIRSGFGNHKWIRLRLPLDSRATTRAVATGVVGDNGVLDVIPEGPVDNRPDHESIRKPCGVWFCSSSALL